jgi:hypothetical protein
MARSLPINRLTGTPTYHTKPTKPGDKFSGTIPFLFVGHSLLHRCINTTRCVSSYPKTCWHRNFHCPHWNATPFSMSLKVAIQDSTSVIMAESAALAVATSLCNTMDFHDVHFLSDNQMLVNCINGADPSNPRIGGLNLLLNWLLLPLWQGLIRCTRSQEIKTGLIRCTRSQETKTRWLILLQDVGLLVYFPISPHSHDYVLILAIPWVPAFECTWSCNH